MARQKDSDGTMQCKKSKVRPKVAQGVVAGKWDLPAGWEWKRLGEVCPYIQRGKSPTYTNADGIPVINQKCIRWNEVLLEHIKYTEQVPSLDEKRLVKKNDILWNSTGTGTIGRAFFVQKEFHFKCVVDSHVTILRPASHIFSKFVHYFIMSNFVQQNIEKMQSGSTNQVELSKEAICDLDIPLPPTVQDQERIVERVDSLFAELDKAEETLRHTITLCEQYKQSVLKAAVTGELSKDWRKANPPTETGEQLLQRILKERRAAWEKAELAKMTAKGQTPANDNWKKKYKEPQAPDTSNLQELPEGWTWASMDMLGAWSGGGTPSKAVADFWEGSIPWVSSKDVKQYYIEDTELHISSVAVTESATNIIQKNSVVMVMRSGVLKHTFPVSIIQVDAAINQDIKSITLVLSVNEHYLMTFLYAHNKKILASCAKDGTTVQSVEYTQLQKYPVPIPPVLEQEHIVKCAQIVIEETEGIIKMCHAQATQTTALRQSILKQAFTGWLK